MAMLKRDHRITQARLGELRATLIGPQSRLLAKIALATEEGEPVASSIFGAWSPRTMRIFDALKRSMEADFVEALGPTQEAPIDDEDLDGFGGESYDEEDYQDNFMGPGSFSAG